MTALFETAYLAIPPLFYEPAPACGMILGSGWSRALAEIEPLARLSYSEIPGLGASTVAGHAGELRLLELNGLRVVAFCGRRHWYEGAGWLPVAVPLELLRRMGVGRVLLTNAAGAVNPDYRPGDFMLLRDHLNTSGINPLQGPVRPGWGTRFPDQSAIYRSHFSNRLAQQAHELGIGLYEGIYAFTAGPCFETPAEVRAYRSWGADAVGMSTVPEAILANAMGLEVAAISCMTNMAAGITTAPLAHEEVLTASETARPRMLQLLNAACFSS